MNYRPKYLTRSVSQKLKHKALQTAPRYLMAHAITKLQYKPVLDVGQK